MQLVAEVERITLDLLDCYTKNSWSDWRRDHMIPLECRRFKRNCQKAHFIGPSTFQGHVKEKKEQKFHEKPH